MAKRIESWFSILTPSLGTIIIVVAVLAVIVAQADSVYIVKWLWESAANSISNTLELLTTLVNNMVTALNNIRIS